MTKSYPDGSWIGDPPKDIGESEPLYYPELSKCETRQIGVVERHKMLQRPKPPTKTKAELMQEAANLVKGSKDPDTALLQILNYFTAVDLDLIIKEWKK